VPPEKGFDKHVERMRAEKAETDKRKAAEEASRAKAWSAEIMPEQRSNLTVAPGTNRPKRSPQQFGVAGAFSCWPQTDTPLRSCRPSAQADQTGGGLAHNKIGDASCTLRSPSICPTVFGLNYLISIAEFAADGDRCKFPNAPG